MKAALIHFLTVFHCFWRPSTGASLNLPVGFETRLGDSSILLRQPGDAIPVTSQGEIAVPSRRAIKQGTQLRILCAGDSITVGYLSDLDGGDGNGYRLQLRDRLTEEGDEVVFAGTDRYSGSTMTDAYFAAWSGKTIKYIDDNLSASLMQRPNVILLHAGTNDMNPNRAVSKEGNNPVEAAERLGDLLDHMIKACPDAVIVVAVIIGTCNPLQSPQTEEFQDLIPEVVKQRMDAGHHVLSVDFSGFPMSDLRDCIHPTNDGYHKLGDYWYDAMTEIPPDWISAPIGPDPERPPEPDSGSTKIINAALSRSVSLMLAILVYGILW